MFKKYYKFAFFIIISVLLFLVTRILWIKFFYFKFGALPVPFFWESDKMDARYIRSAFISVKPDENLKYRKCRVYLAEREVLGLESLRNALGKIGITPSLNRMYSAGRIYKFSSPSLEGILYVYKNGRFVDILLARGNRDDFMNKLRRSLGSQVKFVKNSKNNSNIPLIDPGMTFRIDRGMSQMIRVKLTIYKVLDSTLYKCLDLEEAIIGARSGKISYGQFVQLTKISLKSSNIPALEGGVNVVTDNTYPSPFVLETVRKVLLVVPVDETGHKVYLLPAYILLFKSEGTVESRVGNAYIAREGRVVLPAIVPDWYNK